MSTHNLCFMQKYEKYQNFLSQIFNYFAGKIFSIFELACFRYVVFNLSLSADDKLIFF